MNEILNAVLDRFPSAAISRLMGALSDLELPPQAQAFVNSRFAKLAGIQVAESEHPPAWYPSVNAFFTRRLKPGLRPIDEGEGAFVSPVDGRLAEFGRIGDDGTLVQTKGKTYSLGQLLEQDPDVDRFAGGHYATIYLSPKDYHRIHSPVGGEVVAMAYAPGRLLPVNRLGVEYVDQLFPRNERLTSFVETNRGQLVAVCKVGATCVGRISVTYDDMVTNRSALRGRFRREFGRAKQVERGGELGCFNLGSTVIVAIEGDGFEFRPDLQVGQGVRLGERLGSW